MYTINNPNDKRLRRIDARGEKSPASMLMEYFQNIFRARPDFKVIQIRSHNRNNCTAKIYIDEIEIFSMKGASKKEATLIVFKH